MRGRVIVMETGGDTLQSLTRPVLESAGYRVEAVRGPGEVDGRSVPKALVLLDACLLPPGGAARVVREIRLGAGLPVLQVSGCGAVDAASRSHPIRADDFLVRPFSGSDLVDAVERLLETAADETADFHGMVGRTPAMREVFDAVRLVAPTDSTVLVVGETGTGKELVARAIHALSPVSDGPFVPLDCGSLPESLLASELFGHARGAFTGAVGDHRGLFQAAAGGTLFLDEVGNMPPALQRLLLRALQERSVRPVGTTRTVDVDVRFVAATSRDLARDAREGRFRHDLYYRLSVFPVRVPPLRRRRADVRRIALAHLARKGRVPRGGASITDEALEVLERHPWPGNVRELLGVLDGAAIRAAGEPVGPEHLPFSLAAAPSGRRAGAPGRSGNGGAPAGGALRSPRGSPEEQRERIRLALERAGGHRSRAAALLDMSRTTLWRRMKELEIDG